MIYADKPSKHKQPSRVRLSGPHARKMMEKMRVGKKHAMKVAGKIKSLSANDYDDSIEMDVEDCEHCEGEDMPRSLTRAMRNRKMKNGRFA